MSMLQPLKDLSSNIVTLAFNIFNFEHLDGSYTSDMKEHNGIYWCVRVQSNKTSKSQKRRVSIYLVCNPNNPNPEWTVTASFGFRVINSWGTAKNRISTLFYHVFCAKDNAKGTPGFIAWDDLATSNSGFLVDGIFQVEFDLNVTGFSGIRKEKMSKENYEKYIADGKLIVDGKTIPVCLAFLADNSSVLFDLFYVKNRNGATTFDVFDFSYEAMHGMVSILQLDDFDITLFNYRELLELGQRFKIQPVTEKCENFLLKCDHKVSMANKLKIAETFRLHKLQFRTLEQLGCAEQIEKILDDHIDLGERTCEALLEKLQYLRNAEKNQSKARCTCAKHLQKR